MICAKSVIAIGDRDGDSDADLSELQFPPRAFRLLSNMMNICFLILNYLYCYSL